MTTPSTTTFQLNGQALSVSVSPDTPLLWVIRDVAKLTGTKFGCGIGLCGACTVHLGRRAVRSCITPMSAVEAKPVVTIEGLERDGALHPVQQAFLEASAFQCGYCTPGMIMEAAGLLARKATPSESEIRSEMEGHICRCGAYERIVEAVRRAAQGERRG